MYELAIFGLVVIALWALVAIFKCYAKQIPCSSQHQLDAAVARVWRLHRRLSKLDAQTNPKEFAPIKNVVGGDTRQEHKRK